jgi:hypothetical protein
MEQNALEQVTVSGYLYILQPEEKQLFSQWRRQARRIQLAETG